MKTRYAAFLPLMLLVPACFGQTPFERADQRTFNVYYGACARTSAGWVVSGSLVDDDGSAGNIFLRGITTSGDSAWEVAPTQGSLQSAALSVVAVQNGEFVTANALVDCDVLLDQFLAERRDATGALIWSHTFPYGWLNDMDANAGDSIAYAVDQGILIVDGAGDSLTHLSDDGAYTSGVAWDSAGTLLSWNWSDVLYRWSMLDGLIATDTLGHPIADAAWWFGHRLVLTTNGTLYIYDGDLHRTDSLNLGPGFQTGQLLPLTDRLIVAGNETVYTLDTTVSILASLPTDPNGEFPDDLFQTYAANDSDLFMAAAAGTYALSAGLIRTIRLDGQYTPYEENMGIEVVAIDSVYYNLQNGIVYPRANATVRITNLATTVLNDLVIGHRGPMGPICGIIGSTVHVTGAGLAFGQSLDVPIAGLWLGYAPWNFLSLDQVVCIVSLSPNSVYDRDQSDNYACADVHIVLGIQDRPSDGPGVLVPNPFSGTLDLAFTSPIPESLRVTLFDATGRQLAASTVAAGSTRFHWELPGLSNGVHVLRLEGRSSTTTRELIHQQP